MATAKPLKQRVDRIEQVMHVLAEDQVSLQRLIATLARETRRGFRRVEERFNQVEQRFNRVAEEFRKRDERAAKTDERIDKLGVAIGELTRAQRRDGKA